MPSDKRSHEWNIPRTAPTLPPAAEIPFKVARTSGSKVSEGRKKAVVLGPTSRKKKERPYNKRSTKGGKELFINRPIIT